MSTSREVVVPEPVVPAALAGPATHAARFRQLRGETRLAFLPAGTAAVSGGADLWLHELMVNAIHTNVWAAPLAIAIGAAINGTSTLVATWVLSRKGAAFGLDIKRLGWGSTAAGAVMTLLGTMWPVADLAYPVLAVMGTWQWHKQRWQVRKALRNALLAGSPGTLPASEVAAPAVSVGPTPDAAAAGAAPLATMGEVVDIVGRWSLAVASSHVPDSRLTDGQVHSQGRMSFILHSGDKGTTLEAINKKRDDIASALKLKRTQDVVFDEPAPHEIDGVELDRSQFRMQVINTRSSAASAARVTEQVISSPTNRYSIRIGCYIDTGEPAYLDLADHDGVWSFTVVAGTGLGKSSLVEIVCYRARQLGFHVLWLDPQRGASSPIMKAHADWPALGEEQAMPALRVVEQWAQDREDWLALHDGVGAITPGMVAPCAPKGTHPDPNCECGGVVPPAILVIVEECDMVFGANVGTTNIKQGVWWGKLAKRIRKLGIGIGAVTQLPEIKAFGNDDLLRSNLAVRNLLAMHIASNTNGTLIPGLPYNPRLIPKKPGRALMCGQTTRKMEISFDRLPRREHTGQVGGIGPFAEDLWEKLPKRQPWAADQFAVSEHMPSDGGDLVTAARDKARIRLATRLAGQKAPTPRNVTAEPPAPIGGGIGWAAPITIDDLETMLAASDSVTTAVLAAVADLPDDQWLTIGTLAARMGRVNENADTDTRRATAITLGGELAAKHVTTTRRSDGKSVRVGDLRTTLASN